MDTLSKHVRKTQTLHKAWSKVRESARSSRSAETRARTEEIEQNPYRFIRKLQTQLRSSDFSFQPQRGVTLAKFGGKGKRGLVVSPLENRVVQRAILDTLQSPKFDSNTLGKLPEVLRCETSVGGLPGRGANHAVRLIRNQISVGASFYARSDIRKFFDNVQRDQVREFLEENLSDLELINLMMAAFEIDLANEDEIRTELSLFPSGEIGIAQGNSLSCLAANIVLQEFDKAMNRSGCITPRYIDDFVVLGREASEVADRLANGKQILAKQGLKAYLPSENPDKAAEGQIADGFDFIGCTFNNQHVYPSKSGRKRFLSEVDLLLKDAQRSISKSLDEGRRRRSQDGFLQTLARLDRKIRGWGDAYRFTNNRVVFNQVDKRVTEKIDAFRVWFNWKARGLPDREFGRIYGIAQLADTPDV